METSNANLNLWVAKFTAVVMLTAVPQLLTAQNISCGMTLDFKQPDGNAAKGNTSVWSDTDKKSMLFVDSLNVNTDGTPRSYSVEDFWGEKDALNNLCNAMSDACAGLSSADKKNRRISTQKASAEGWPEKLLKEIKIAPSIIPFVGGKPCPSVNGFLVSATSLQKANIKDICDISNYVDSLVTPAIVVPRNPSKSDLSEFAKRNARVGDLVVAMVPGSSTPVFAVIGDTGPVGQLGEGSLALNGKLLKKAEKPVNYLEVRGKGLYKGKAWTVPYAAVLIFPGTRDAANPYITTDRLDAAAKARFDAWGGLPRLEACLALYKN